MIKRNFTDRTKETILPLYKSLVRPHLDYCSQIWNPHYVHTHTHTHVRLLDERLTDRNLNNDTARPNVSFKMQL